MSRRRATILVLIDLIQDADVLMPVLTELRSRSIPTRVVVSRWLETAAPRVAALLKRHGFAFRFETRSRIVAGQAPDLAGVAAVLLASESSQEAHRGGHALAWKAASAGVPCALLQHGLDMSGLTRDFDVRFASGTVFAWSATLPIGLSSETAAKVVSVGRPASPAPRGGAVRKAIGVFENLHWDIYDDIDRGRFVANLERLARARPDLPIIARAHPAGGWLDRHTQTLAALPNVQVVTSDLSRRSLDGAGQLLASCAKVITTPSTLALDAAQAGCGVALAIDGGPLYAPLPVLEDGDDWIAFADAPAESTHLRTQSFAERAVVAGDASARIVDWLASRAAA